MDTVAARYAARLTRRAVHQVTTVATTAAAVVAAIALVRTLPVLDGLVWLVALTATGYLVAALWAVLLEPPATIGGAVPTRAGQVTAVLVANTMLFTAPPVYRALVGSLVALWLVVLTVGLATGDLPREPQHEA